VRGGVHEAVGKGLPFAPRKDTPREALSKKGKRGETERNDTHESLILSERRRESQEFEEKRAKGPK